MLSQLYTTAGLTPDKQTASSIPLQHNGQGGSQSPLGSSCRTIEIPSSHFGHQNGRAMTAFVAAVGI